MSMTTYQVGFYGVTDVMNNVNVEMLENFLERHNVKEVFLEDLNADGSLAEVYEELCDEREIYDEIAVILSDIHGVRIEYLCPDEFSVDGMGFVETYPWYLNEKEKYLTERDIQGILYDFVGSKLIADTQMVEYYE